MPHHFDFSIILETTYSGHSSLHDTTWLFRIIYSFLLFGTHVLWTLVFAGDHVVEPNHLNLFHYSGRTYSGHSSLHDTTWLCRIILIFLLFWKPRTLGTRLCMIPRGYSASFIVFYYLGRTYSGHSSLQATT